MNIKFNYLYRDGGNYKQNHFEIFSNAEGLSIEAIDWAIRKALIEQGWFFANEWKLRDLHLYRWDETIDHNWHEYDCVELTEEKETMGDIADFIKMVGSKATGATAFRAGSIATTSRK